MKEVVLTFLNIIREFIQKNILISLLASLGLILLSIGVIQSLNYSKNDIEFENGQNLTSENKDFLQVDIEGEVIKPGVYKLSSVSRVQDLLIASGGLSKDADREYVAKNINLAQKLTDGQKIYIPASGAIGGLTVSLNSGSLADLDNLIGITKATAQKIIDNRPYNSKEELVQRQILKEAAFNKIKDLISVY